MLLWIISNRLIEKKKQEKRHLHNGYHQKAVTIQSKFRSGLFFSDFFITQSKIVS